jgi:hypothetical protein
MDGGSGVSIPDDRRFSLICDADGAHRSTVDGCFLKKLLNERERVLKDLLCIMLNPPRLREKLGVFGLPKMPDLPCMIEQNTARAGCSLIDRKNELSHGI